MSKKISLLKFMESYSCGNRTDGFKKFAQKFNQSYQSVRNVYYKTLRNLSNEDLIKYNLRGSKHIIHTHKPFSDIELRDKIGKIMTLYNKGFSLRSSCLMVSNDDKVLALRYQNKIRSLNLQKQKNNVLRIPNVQGDSNVKDVYDTKLLYMSKASSGITDQDINNLFLGLIKLVKRTYENQIGNNLKRQFNSINIELKEKNLKLEKQKNQNMELLDENISLKKKIDKYREDLEKQSVLYNKKLGELEKTLQKFNNSLKDEVNKL